MGEFIENQNRHTRQGDKSIYAEQGDITVNYGDQDIPKNLTKPPFVSDVFIGRERDVKAVREKLFEDNQFLLLVNGEGGIGKTTLAAHYYHSFEDDYRHLAWVFAETSLLDALLALALPLQIAFSENLPPLDRLDALLTAMAELDKPCLLVVDNANNLRDLENHYQALRSCPNFHVVLTTRITEFQQAACHRVGCLDPSDAMMLFKGYYPGHQDEENPVLENILSAVGYNTLVIELLAKNLRTLNRLKSQYNLADLLKELQEKGLLALKSQAVTTGYQSHGKALRKETPESIVAAMYDLSQLSGAEKSLLSVFAVLPAENIAYPMLESLLPGSEDLDATLLGLAQKGWLEHEEADAALKVSPVVQEITRQKNRERLLRDSEVLINELVKKLDYEPGTGHFLTASYAEAAVFAHYAESIIQRICQTSEGVAILCERVGSYHSTTGNLTKALEFFLDYSRYEQELYEAYADNVSFKNGLAISYSKLGETHTALGNLERALGFFEKDLQVTKELYEAYADNVSFKNGLAISYIKLGAFFEKTKNKAKARENYLLSKDLLTQLVSRSPKHVEFKNNLDWVVSKLSGL